MTANDLTGIEEYSKKTTEEASSTAASSSENGEQSDHDLFPTSDPGTAPAQEEDLPDLSQSFVEGSLSTPEPLPDFPEPEPPAPTDPGAATLENVRRYSEQISEKRDSVPAAYPFSLLIEGDLRPSEREKLLDLLARHGMGIREVDIEPQFESGRILIPRISEYAAVLLIQGLRDVNARIQAGPSDEIFSTRDTRDGPAAPAEPSGKKSAPDEHHDAESIPITAGGSLPWLQNYTVLGVLTASATLKSSSIETEASPEYQEILESLQIELRYRAHHKGATAILNYSIQLTPLQLSRHYRVSVAGTAVKSD